MANIRPSKKFNIIKKKTKPFGRFNSDQFLRVKPSWRRSRGIDNPMRRRFKGARLIPKIGYRNDKETRHRLPNGFKKLTYPFYCFFDFFFRFFFKINIKIFL